MKIITKLVVGLGVTLLFSVNASAQKNYSDDAKKPLKAESTLIL